MLRKAAAEETAAREALQVAYSSAQKFYEDLEQAAVAACQGLEGEGGSSGSSLASRLRSLGGRVTQRLKGALRLSVHKALSVVSTHYIIDLEQVPMGYVIAKGADEDAAVAAIEQAAAAAEGAATALSGIFEGELLPGADDDEDDAPKGLRNREDAP